MHRRHFLYLTGCAGLGLAQARAEAPPAKVRVGVIGHTGRGNYGHGLDAMWTKLPETEIVAVADADAKGLAAAQAHLGVARGYADYREMLAEAKPEVVAIAPRFLDEHLPMALAAIAAGARGIYMEKPFCRSLAEADAIIAAAEKTGTKIALAHRNRYHPALAAVDRLLQEGAIGSLLELRGRGKEDARGGGVDLWVLGAHLFNLVHYFGGAPLACSAVLLQDGRPVTAADVQEGQEGIGPVAGNAVHARFEMEKGIPAFFDSVQNAGVASAGFGLQLIGTKGFIDLRIDATPLAHLMPGSPFQPTAEPRPWIPISSAGPGVPEPILNLRADSNAQLLGGRDLLSAIRENRAPVCDAHAGRVTVEMITAVVESHLQGGRRVSFPLGAKDNPLASLSVPAR